MSEQPITSARGRIAPVFRPEELEEYRDADPAYELIPLHSPDAIDANGAKLGKVPHKGWRTDEPFGDVTDAKEHLESGRNVGVRLGALDLVIDVDPRNFALEKDEEGPDQLQRLQDDLGIDLSPFVYPRVITGSGGFHIYTRLPAATEFSNTLEKYPGIEFKTLGRQVVAAGSIHPDTRKPYVFDRDPMAARLRNGVPEAPEALVELARKKADESGPVEAGRFTPDELATWLEALKPEDYREHDPWLELMMACHHATGGEGRDEFVTWSTSDPQYSNDAWKVGRRWDSFRNAPGKRKVTYKTLFKRLVEAGRMDLLPQWSSAEDDFAGLPDEDERPSKKQRREAAASEVRRRRRVLEYSFQPNEWIIDNYMLVGLNLVAGTWGVGKSTNLIPVAATVAHVTPPEPAWDLPRPRLRRKVVWITEDPEQATLTLLSIMRVPGAASAEEMSEWFIIEEASRMDPDDMATSIAELVDEFGYTNDYGFEVKPLIVIDTSSANLELESENDNSEVGRAMAALKGTRAPVILVGHTAKDIKRSDLESMSFRGGGAYEADSRGTYYLVHDEADGVDAGRHLVLNKRRFSNPAFTEIAFDGQFGAVEVAVPWGPDGETQTVGFCHGVPRRSTREKREAAKVMLREEQLAKKAEDRSNKVLETIEKLIAEKQAPTKGAVVAAVGGKSDLTKRTVAELLEDGVLEAHALTKEDREAFGLPTAGRAPEVVLPSEMAVDELRKLLVS